MNNENFIKGSNEEEIWQQISKEFLTNLQPLQYTAIIDHGKHRIIFDIDIDMGGGFESGFETTTFSAAISAIKNFQFTIRKEHFTDEISKLFGMQDVITGYDDVDKKLIIKTNDADKIKAIFQERSVREMLLTLRDFTFTLSNSKIEDQGQETLELMIEQGITDINNLRDIYAAFYLVLETIDSTL